MTLNPHTVSVQHQIREMDAIELLSFLSQMKKQPADYKNYNELVAMIRLQYRQLTGSFLTLATIARL